MKKNLILLTTLSLFMFSCIKEKPIEKVIDESLNFSVKQYELMYNVMNDKPGLLPRSIDTSGTLITSRSGWWCSGFFPGSLWYSGIRRWFRG
ncbi:MAG: hypothetical protein NT092_09865 [Bacteroidia bacterium]|nr:hypothetical protein [Bacteroidia bacterium]